MIDHKDLQVDIQDIDSFHVAYVRHVGPYKGDNALFEQLFKKLFAWAGPRGLVNFPESKTLSLYHDDPKTTEEKDLRTSICISVPEDTPVDGEIGLMKIEGGKYAVARFEVSTDECEEAWKALYGGWLPQSGYQQTEHPPFEQCMNNPKEHPEGKYIFNICIPVKPV